MFLGTLARALDGRGPDWLPAVLLAATATSHLVVLVFAVYAAFVLWCNRRPRRSAARLAAIGAVGLALTAVWLLPLIANLRDTTDMRYEPVGGTLSQYLDWMFLWDLHWYVLGLACIGVLSGVYYRRRSTIDLGGIALAAGVFFMGWETLRDLVHKAPAWNLRLLPFWYLSLYLLAALGAAQIVRWAASLVAGLVAWLSAADLDDEPTAVTEGGGGEIIEPRLFEPPRPVGAAPPPEGFAAAPPAAGRVARPDRLLDAPTRVLAIAMLAAVLAAAALRADRRDEVVPDQLGHVQLHGIRGRREGLP